MIKASFRDQGIARSTGLARTGAAGLPTAGKPADPAAVAKQIEASTWPRSSGRGGQYLGDWREGEKAGRRTAAA